MFIIDSSLKLELCGFCLVFVRTPQVYIYESVASQCTGWVVWDLTYHVFMLCTGASFINSKLGSFQIE